MGTGRKKYRAWLGAVVLAAGLAGCESDTCTAACSNARSNDAQAPLPPVDAAQPPPKDAAMDASPPADATTPDSGRPDTGTRDDDEDAGSPPPDAQVDATMPLPTFAPNLSGTGLFVPGSTNQLAPDVQAYTPRYALWSDGAEKERWFYLPPDTQIDTSDMDYWKFPVGTKAWKLFTRDGKKLETRLLEKQQSGWIRIAYAWNDAETEAVAVPEGAQDVRGTTHDIPNRTACNSCHSGLPDRLLGVSAIQLSHSGAGMTLATLSAAGKLSAPPAAPFALPDSTQWNALGYMHANCGHCHNPLGEPYDRLDLDLWLRTAQLGDVTQTESYKTTVNEMLTDTASALTLRIAPGDADMSGLIQRMELRGNEQAMPPIASEQVDTTGAAAVRAWIDDL